MYKTRAMIEDSLKAHHINLLARDICQAAIVLIIGGIVLWSLT